MENEFNLSEKQCFIGEDVILNKDIDFILTSDVKEFIKRLKEELCKEHFERPFVRYSNLDRISQRDILEVIDKLAGPELNGTKIQ